MRPSCRLAALAATALLCLFSRATPGLEPSHLVAGFSRGQAVLETGGPRCLLLDVYVARTAEQRARGLMFVEDLPEYEGMYFGYDYPVELSMWMKNTGLPLDMLFILEDGRVGLISRNTRPFSTERITSGGPVVGVLEVNAGFAVRWRVESGTRLLLLF